MVEQTVRAIGLWSKKGRLKKGSEVDTTTSPIKVLPGNLTLIRVVQSLKIGV